MRTYALIGFFVILIVALSTLLIIQGFMSVRKTVPPTKPVPTQQPYNMNNQAHLFLKSDRGPLFSSLEPMTVSVVANSNDRDIVSFDIVLLFDPKKVKYIEEKSTDPNFQIFTRPSEGQLIITGVRKLGSTPSALPNTTLTELSFEPLVKEPFDIKLQFTPGNKKDSNLIDKESQDILQSVQNLHQGVGESLSLSLKQKKSIANDLSITLTEATDRAAQCIDRLSQATVVVEQGTERRELHFRFGGIAGFNEDTASAFGYTFEIQTLGKGTVDLLYGK